MKKIYLTAAVAAAFSLNTMAQSNSFDYNVDRFADIQCFAIKYLD